MPWAAKRRLIISIIGGSVVAAFLIIILISALYKTPTCTDGKQNQGEVGVDCGGPCTYLCTAQVQPPSILFTNVLDNGARRSDVIAVVENKNATAAAKNVPYRITLYNVGRVLLQEINGVIDLPPGARVPVYIPGIVSKEQKVTSAFLTIDPSAAQWFSMATDSRVLPTVSSIVNNSTATLVRIDAVLVNSDVSPLSNVQAVILVYDSKKNVIAASQTVVPIILPQGQATATFTWNESFTNVPATMEVIPIIPLP